MNRSTGLRDKRRGQRRPTERRSEAASGYRESAREKAKDIATRRGYVSVGLGRRKGGISISERLLEWVATYKPDKDQLS